MRKSQTVDTRFLAPGLFGRFRETSFLPGLPVRFGTAKKPIIWRNIFRSLSVIEWIDSLADKWTVPLKNTQILVMDLRFECRFFGICWATSFAGLIWQCITTT